MKKNAIQFLTFGCLLIVVACGCRGASAPQDPDSSNSMALDLAAIVAHQGKNLEEAGVLFVKAKARFEVDRIVYPPAGAGDSHPAVLRSALSAMFASPITRDLRAKPKVFLKVVRRLEKWEPEFPDHYDPGWKYKFKVGDDEVAKAIEKVREGLLPALRKQATLLSDEGYQQALADQRESRQQAKARDQKLKDTRKKLASEGKSTREVELQGYADYLLARDTDDQHLLKLHEIEWNLVPESRWHNKVDWKAEDFFDDAKVVELCHAIENNNLKQMQALIDEEVDVNTKGVGNMTPLLWSYSDYKFERFQMLLDAGADPNVVTTSDFGIERQRFHPNLGQTYRHLAFEEFNKGSSVNILAYQAADARYSWAVLKHGGDVNQAEPETGQSPLHLVMAQFPRSSESLKMIKALIEKGVDLEYPDPYRGHRTPLQMVLQRGLGNFETAIMLVKSGADPNKKGKRIRYGSPAHLFLEKEGELESYKKYRPEQILKYKELKTVMAAHGADFKTARAELDKGPAWGKAQMRQEDLRNLHRRVIRERESPSGAVQVYDPSAPRYRWTDYTDQNQNRSWAKYYQHTSRDCSRPPRSSAVAFSIKHVSKNEIPNIENCLPEFAALGNRTVLVSPSFSGHPNWLDGNGGHLVDYLRHLVAKRCRLMERSSKDFSDFPTSKEGYYFLEIADDKRHHQVLIPAEYLRDGTLREESGLGAFEEVWKVIEKLKLRAMVGDQQQTGKLFKMANDQLKSQFPDTKVQFHIHHLMSAKRDDDGKLRCTLAFPADKDAKTQRVYSAICERVAGELNIKVTRDDVDISDEERN